MKKWRPGASASRPPRTTTLGTYKMASRQWIIGLTLLLVGAAPAEKASRPMSTIKIERWATRVPSPKREGWRKSEAVEYTPHRSVAGQDGQLLSTTSGSSKGVLGRYQQKIASVDTAPDCSRLWARFPHSSFSEHLLVNRRRNPAAALVRHQRRSAVSSAVDEQVFGELDGEIAAPES